MPGSPDKRKVFVVNGRDEQLRKEMYAFLRAIDLHPMEFTSIASSTRKGSPYIGEILDEALEQAQAFLVLMTPDESVTLKASLTRSSDTPAERAPRLTCPRY